MSGCGLFIVGRGLVEGGFIFCFCAFCFVMIQVSVDRRTGVCVCFFVPALFSFVSGAVN